MDYTWKISKLDTRDNATTEIANFETYNIVFAHSWFADEAIKKDWAIEELQDRIDPDLSIEDDATEYDRIQNDYPFKYQLFRNDVLLRSIKDETPSWASW